MQNLKEKSHAQRHHFKKRLKERYGIQINNDAYRAFIAAIQTGERQPVTINGHSLNVVASYRTRQSHRVSVYILRFSGITDGLPVAYDTNRGQLITTHPELLGSHKNLDSGVIPG